MNINRKTRMGRWCALALAVAAMTGCSAGTTPDPSPTPSSSASAGQPVPAQTPAPAATAPAGSGPTATPAPVTVTLRDQLVTSDGTRALGDPQTLTSGAVTGWSVTLEVTTATTAAAALADLAAQLTALGVSTQVGAEGLSGSAQTPSGRASYDVALDSPPDEPGVTYLLLMSTLEPIGQP